MTRRTDPFPGGGTVNESFFDALVRHQIGLLRVSGSIRNKIYALLDATEADIAEKLRSSAPLSLGSKRLTTLLDSIKAVRLKAWEQVTTEWLTSLREIAAAEPKFVDGFLKTVSPATLDTILPPVSVLTSIVKSRPFEGRTLKEWASSLRRTDLQRIEDHIKIGVVQGETGQQIARRVVGTYNLKGADGVTEITRRDAASITRTAVNSISNAARSEYFQSNAALFQKELFVATLDGRTTPICRSLDGKQFDVGDGPTPPLHFNCRSLRVAAVAPSAIGQRPARPFTERQLIREYASKNGLGKITSRSGLPRGQKGRYDAFASQRMRELTGRVPSKVTYQAWLTRQPASFQDDVLGPSRATLFRRGGLTLDKFVDQKGREIPLSALAAQHRRAFVAAGLDPEDFL